MVLGRLRKKAGSWTVRRMSESARTQVYAAAVSGAQKQSSNFVKDATDLQCLLLQKDFGNKSLRLAQKLKRAVEDHKKYVSNQSFESCFALSDVLIKEILSKEFSQKSKDFLGKRFEKYMNEVVRNYMLELSEEYKV